MGLLDLIMAQMQQQQGNWSPGSEAMDTSMDPRLEGGKWAPESFRRQIPLPMAPDQNRPRSYTDALAGDMAFQPVGPTAQPKPKGPGFMDRMYGKVGLGDPVRRRRFSEGAMSMGSGLLSRKWGEGGAQAFGRGVSNTQQSLQRSDQREMNDRYRARMQELSDAEPEGSAMGTYYGVLASTQPRAGAYGIPQMYGSMARLGGKSQGDELAMYEAKQGISDRFTRGRSGYNEGIRQSRASEKDRAKFSRLIGIVGKGTALSDNDNAWMTQYLKLNAEARIMYDLFNPAADREAAAGAGGTGDIVVDGQQ
jgi:hypothetical protein